VTYERKEQYWDKIYLLLLIHMIYREVNHMKTESQRIVLPKELQKEILKFFLRTSIPRKFSQKKLNTDYCNTEKQDGIEDV
jgi:hypothetical protein